jgi:hypothetical protein
MDGTIVVFRDRQRVDWMGIANGGANKDGAL